MQRTALGQTLTALIEKNHGSQRKFAEACGVDQATVHHVINGRPCSRENLQKFCRHISSKPDERFEVLIAHLFDEAEASGLDTADLVIRRGGELMLAEVKMSPALQRDLATLAAQAVHDDELRDLIALNASMVRRFRARHDGDGDGHAPARAVSRKARPVVLGDVKPSDQRATGTR